MWKKKKKRTEGVEASTLQSRRKIRQILPFLTQKVTSWSLAAFCKTKFVENALNATEVFRIALQVTSAARVVSSRIVDRT